MNRNELIDAKVVLKKWIRAKGHGFPLYDNNLMIKQLIALEKQITPLIL